MFVKQFEIFHGIALTKLLRSEKPVSVRLIETKPTEDWQVYGIMDADLFVKHRATSLNRKRGGYSWQFVFSTKETSRIGQKDNRPMYVALVCGQPKIQEEMEICFLNPEQIENIFPLENAKPFSLTVRSEPRHRLAVIVDRKVRDLIPRNAIDKWEIEGK